MSRDFALSLILVFFVSACGGSGDSGNGGGGNNPNQKPIPENRVDWGSVASEYNPSIEDISFQTMGIERIEVDAFDFDRDAEVVYSTDVAADAGYLRLYKVFKGFASWGSLIPKANGKTLQINGEGMHQCGIRIRNGRIISLEGGCYVRLQVVLPVGSQIEVFNLGKLISDRFIPMSVEEFLKDVDDASFSEDKFKVIESFLATYAQTGKTPSLTAYQLGLVVDEFIRSEEQFDVLRKLHMYVRDRQNLAAMIEKEFSYFDREEARKIVGL